MSIHRAKGPNPIPFWWAAETEDQGMQLAAQLRRRMVRFAGDADQKKLTPEALRKLSRTGSRCRRSCWGDGRANGD